MRQDWLVYWKSAQLRDSLRQGLLGHAAGEQLGAVELGDRLWIVGRVDDRELATVGYIDVDEILSRNAATNRLGKDIYQATYHVVCAEPIRARKLGLKPLYPSLRFISDISPRMKVVNGHPPAQQFQHIRRLTPKSGKDLSRLWHKTATATFRQVDRSFSAFDREQRIVRRGEQAAVRSLLVGEAEVADCGICGETLPVSLLVAAHLKPRSVCTPAEKCDIRDNIVLMCKLGCDDLFEKGFIAVDSGKIVVGISARQTDYLKIRVEELVGRDCPSWLPSRARYFRWRLSREARRWLKTESVK